MIKFLKNLYGELTTCEVHVQADLNNILTLPNVFYIIIEKLMLKR